MNELIKIESARSFVVSVPAVVCVFHPGHSPTTIEQLYRFSSIHAFHPGHSPTSIKQLYRFSSSIIFKPGICGLTEMLLPIAFASVHDTKKMRKVLTPCVKFCSAKKGTNFCMHQIVHN